MMCNVIKWSMILAVLVCLPVSADVVDLYAAADTWIEDGSEDAHGSDTNLQVREETATAARRYALVEWDLSSLAGATINSVEMYFYTTSASTTLYPSAYMITSDWDENATYTKRTATQNWTNPGVDYQSTEVAKLAWNVYVNQYKSVIQGGTDVDFTAMVQGWVDNPATNYGILVKRPADSGARQGSFSSSEGNPAYLSIDYTPVPEPVTILLLTAGAMCLRRKNAAK